MGAFDPLTRIICFVAYAGFCVVGIVLMATSIWYNANVPAADDASLNDVVMISLAAGGCGMFAVGGLALFSIFKQHAVFLWVVWLADVVIFIVITVGAVFGIILGMDVRDPTREALDRSFSEALWRETWWDGGYCQDHSTSTHCTAVFMEQATTALAATDANYTAGDTVRHLFGDCTYAKLGVPCPVSQNPADVEICEAIDMDSVAGIDDNQQAACEAVAVGKGCVFTPPVAAIPAACTGDDDGTGDPATCSGTATTPVCELGPAGCPAGCDSTPASTPVCQFASGTTGCPDGCSSTATTCSGTATTTPATCTGTATTPVCDLNAVNQADCAAGCVFTPRGAGAPCQLNGDDSACAVQGGDCTFSAFVEATPRTCTVKPDCTDRDLLFASCSTCVNDCKEAIITDVKSGMEPAAISLIVAFVFTVICVVINHYVRLHQPDGGLAVLLALIFNALVALTGLVVVGLAAYGQYLVVEECPSTSDCTNLAAIFLIMLGMGMFVVGGLGAVGTKFRISFFMTAVNAVHSLLAFGLLVASAFVFIVSGHMETINAQSEAHFPDLRKQFESQQPDYCKEPDNPAQPLSDTACRLKMRGDIEDNMTVFGYALLLIALGFMVTMYFTWQAIKMLHGDDGDDDDDDGED